MKKHFNCYEEAKAYFSKLRLSAIKNVENLAFAVSFCTDKINSRLPDEDIDFWYECLDKLDKKVIETVNRLQLDHDKDLLEQLEKIYSPQEIACFVSFSLDWEEISDEDLRYISDFHSSLPEGLGEEILFKELCRERCRRSPFPLN